MKARIALVILFAAVAGCGFAPSDEPTAVAGATVETESALLGDPPVCNFSSVGTAPYYISPCTSSTGEVASFNTNGIVYLCDHETRPVVGASPCIGYAFRRVVVSSCDGCQLSFGTPWKHGVLGTWTWNGGGYPVPSDSELLANPSAYSANRRCYIGPSGFLICDYYWTTAYWTLTSGATYTLSYNNATKKITSLGVIATYASPSSNGTYTKTVNTAPDGTMWGTISIKDSATGVISNYTFLYPFVPQFATGAYTLQVYSDGGVPYRNYIR